MPEIMTTKELANYLKLHEITITKYAREGKIPAIRVGRFWRFDKEVIDRWIGESHKNPQTEVKSKAIGTQKAPKKQLPKKQKSRRK